MFDLIKNDKTFTVFDIGFGKVVCLSFKINNNKPKIIGMDYQKSEGLKKFDLYDSEKLGILLEKVLKNIHGKRIKFSSNIFFSNISDVNLLQKKNLSKINNVSFGISKKNVRSIFKKNLLESKVKGKRIIHSFPQNFLLDENRISNDPIGEKCNTLGISSLNLLADNKLLLSFEHCFKKINISINSFFDSGVCAAYSSTTDNEKEDGVLCLDIGALTTKIVVIENKKVIYSNIIPLGGAHVTKDLHNGLQISEDSAETVKILHGTLSPSFNNNIEVRINSTVKKHINENILFGIIKPRYEEILEIIRDLVFDNINTRVSIKNIVLSGGASKIYGLSSLCENIFNRRCRIGLSNPSNSFFFNKPEFATILGMIMLAQDYKKFQFTKKVTSSKVFNVIDKLENWIEESYA